MKKDFRVQYPLWQMAFIVLFGFMAFSFTGVSTELNQNSEGFSYSLEFNSIRVNLFIWSTFHFIYFNPYIHKKNLLP